MVDVLASATASASAAVPASASASAAVPASASASAAVPASASASAAVPASASASESAAVPASASASAEASASASGAASGAASVAASVAAASLALVLAAARGSVPESSTAEIYEAGVSAERAAGTAKPLAAALCAARAANRRASEAWFEAEQARQNNVDRCYADLEAELRRAGKLQYWERFTRKNYSIVDRADSRMSWAEWDAKKQLAAKKAACEAAAVAARAPVGDQVRCNFQVLKRETCNRILGVLTAVVSDERDGAQAFFADVLERGWCAAIKGRANFAPDLGGMLLALYSRKCRSATMRIMAQYMGDDPLVFLAAVMLGQTLRSEALELPRRDAAGKTRLLRIASSALSLIKTAPASAKTLANFVFVFATMRGYDDGWLFVPKALLEDEDFVAAVCAVAPDKDMCPRCLANRLPAVD